MADTAGFLSFILVAVALAGWIHGLQAVQLEGRRGLFTAVFGLAFALALAAFVLGASLFAGIAALFGLLASAVFLGLTVVGRQARKEPAVRVGGPLIDFTAPSEDGTLFESTSLRGRSFLLKFFRGHW